MSQSTRRFNRSQVNRTVAGPSKKAPSSKSQSGTTASRTQTTQSTGRRTRNDKPLKSELSESESDEEAIATSSAPAPSTRKGQVGKRGTAPGTPFTQSQRGKKTASQSQPETNDRSIDELVQQVVQYFIVLHAKKIPLKKSEIVKNSMSCQSKDFGEVIVDVSEVLEDIFGCRLVAMKIDEAGVMQVVPLLEGNIFMLVSMFKSSLIETSGLRRNDSHNDGKRGLIRIILNCIHMLNRDIDEDYIWQIITTLNCQVGTCPRREDLRRFLKSECVDPMYLDRQETKGVDGSTFRYTWGIRAEMECDKYAILKHISQALGKVPQNFKTQFFELMKNPEFRELIAADKENEGVEDSDSENLAGAMSESCDDELEEILETQAKDKLKKNKQKRPLPESSSESEETSSD